MMLQSAPLSCVRNPFFKKSLSSCTFRFLATSAQKRAAKRLAAQGKPVPTRPGLLDQKPINTKNILKAPHMTQDAVKSKGILDRVKEAPFIPMVVILPTAMMGIALIIRPDFREQIFGSSKVKKAIPIDPDSASEDYKTVMQEVQKLASEGAQVPQAIVALDAIPKEQVSTQQSDNAEEENREEVRDLIYAIGIRPHPSS